MQDYSNPSLAADTAFLISLAFVKLVVVELLLEFSETRVAQKYADLRY